MKRISTSGRRAAAALLLACTALGPSMLSAQVPPATPIDVAILLDDAAAGDTATLEAALPIVTGKGPAALLRARIAASRLDTRLAAAALRDFSASGDAAPAHLAAARGIEADLAFGNGDYAAAARAYRQLLPLLQAAGKTEEAAGTGQTLSVATLLADQPRQAIAGGTAGALPTTRDKAGLTRAEVTINGTPQDAVFDTGANLSVVTVSAAKRLGLRMIEGEASVASSGAAAVPTRLAIADRLVIAGIALRNVAFLVLDDSKLEFPLPGGYRIDAIIGFPVFRALGRIEFSQTGSFRAGGPATHGVPGGNLRSAGNDLYVVAAINGIAATLHLDTGASSTALSSRFAGQHPDLVATLATGNRRIAGAGGAVSQPVALWQPATVTIGGRSLGLPKIQVVLGGEATERETRLGTLGQDVLGAFQSYAIDFRTMQFELGAPR